MMDEKSSAIPADVMAALDRMCTPLDKSVLAGATAEADAHSMKLIREYVFSSALDTSAIWSTDAARDVLAERARQVGAEGFTPTHDDQHDDGVLVCAAIAYAGADTVNYPINEPPDMWPWAREWWKPTDDRRNLVKAAALLIAEIERLDRAGGGDADAHA